MANASSNITTPAAPIKGGARKRQQIESSNRSMFIWVAAGSVIVAFALVGSIFLSKQIIFNQKVLIEDNKTAGILTKNIANAKTLDSSVNDLRADPTLSQVPASSDSSNNLDKVLDALPYEGDWVGLGSSLQSTLLSGISIDTLSVDSTTDPTGTTDSGVDVSDVPTVGDALPITFTFKVSGSDTDLKALLSRLNNSIRPIKILNMKLEAAGPDRIDATVQAVTYYQLEQTFQLQQEVVKP